MRVEREVPQFLEEEDLRVVLAALALADDYAPLRFRLLWVERGVAHPLRLDHQRRVEMVRRDGFEVDREVRVREPVELAAKAADNRVDVALLELAAALEQHVLDPVRRARDPRPLVPRADLVADPYGDRRRLRHGV